MLLEVTILVTLVFGVFFLCLCYRRSQSFSLARKYASFDKAEEKIEVFDEASRSAAPRTGKATENALQDIQGTIDVALKALRQAQSSASSTASPRHRRPSRRSSGKKSKPDEINGLLNNFLQDVQVAVHKTQVSLQRLDGSAADDETTSMISGLTGLTLEENFPVAAPSTHRPRRRKVEEEEVLDAPEGAVPDPEHCVVKGGGLRNLVTSQEAILTLEARDSENRRITTGGHRVTARLRGTSKCAASVEDNEDGTYKISFTPPVSGVYEVDIRLSSIRVGGAPWTIQCTPRRVEAALCEVTGNALAEAPHPAGEELRFMLASFDQAGELIMEGGAVIEASLNGVQLWEFNDPNEPTQHGDPFTLDIDVHDSGDGTYHGAFACMIPGKHELTIMADGIPVSPDPFVVEIVKRETKKKKIVLPKKPVRKIKRSELKTKGLYATVTDQKNVSSEKREKVDTPKSGTTRGSRDSAEAGSPASARDEEKASEDEKAEAVKAARRQAAQAVKAAREKAARERAEAAQRAREKAEAEREARERGEAERQARRSAAAAELARARKKRADLTVAAPRVARDADNASVGSRSSTGSARHTPGSRRSSARTPGSSRLSSSARAAEEAEAERAHSGDERGAAGPVPPAADAATPPPSETRKKAAPRRRIHRDGSSVSSGSSDTSISLSDDEEGVIVDRNGKARSRIA